MIDLNRRLHEALGKCWHEFPGNSFMIWEDGKFKRASVETNETYSSPDYCADPRLVIEAMREYCGDDEYELAQFFFYLPIYGTYPHALREFSDLIMDKTGKLAELALEFIEGRKG